jgi:hypothetical protein
MQVIYRISEVGYPKDKPDYINNKNCFENALRTFNKVNWLVIADNVTDETKLYLESKVETINYVNVGHGAGTFNLALDYALTLDNNEIVYFLENDYLHKPEADKILEEAFELNIDYVSPYLHPDKFLSPLVGGNPEVNYDGSYVTKIYRGKTQLFGVFNSTTMTFAAKVETLKEDESILRKWTSDNYPYDFQMFLELKQKGRVLVCPLEPYSTHGETKWLAPLSGIEQEDLVKEWKRFC